MGKPFASVLIDTYNHERFIEQAISSVLEQDFPASDREILVVDDGSTDRTPEIVRKFEPQLRLLRKANGGQASAFNVGIPECQGEIVAFLDGDDWWAAGKLKAVAEALASEASVGLVGHGITEVFLDGRQHAELLKENPRFRIDSEAGGHLFRLRKSFLGTSRMAYRANLLHQIGNVPEALKFEADEYLFTLAGFLAEVLILRNSFTFYRLHKNNAFQIGDGKESSIRRKQRMLETLGELLRTELVKRGAPEDLVRMVADWIMADAELLRLSLDAGFPWETVRAELRNYHIMYDNAPLSRRVLKYFSLLPACVMASRTYYGFRNRLMQNNTYRKARERWLPFQKPGHVDRLRTTRP